MIDEGKMNMHRDKLLESTVKPVSTTWKWHIITTTFFLSFFLPLVVRSESLSNGVDCKKLFLHIQPWFQASLSVLQQQQWTGISESLLPVGGTLPRSLSFAEATSLRMVSLETPMRIWISSPRSAARSRWLLQMNCPTVRFRFTFLF